VLLLALLVLALLLEPGAMQEQHQY